MILFAKMVPKTVEFAFIYINVLQRISGYWRY